MERGNKDGKSDKVKGRVDTQNVYLKVLLSHWR